MLFGHTTSNKMSRFVDEIPEEYVDMKSASRGFGEHAGGFTGQTGGFYGQTGGRNTYNTTAHRAPERRQRAIQPPTPAAKPSLPDFSLGDAVEHTAFGHGIITGMRPMGNDSLVEIEFEGVGAKKLMLRAAAQHMTKA